MPDWGSRLGQSGARPLPLLTQTALAHHSTTLHPRPLWLDLDHHSAVPRSFAWLSIDCSVRCSSSPTAPITESPNILACHCTFCITASRPYVAPASLPGTGPRRLSVCILTSLTGQESVNPSYAATMRNMVLHVLYYFSAPPWPSSLGSPIRPAIPVGKLAGLVELPSHGPTVRDYAMAR